MAELFELNHVYEQIRNFMLTKNQQMFDHNCMCSKEFLLIIESISQWQLQFHLSRICFVAIQYYTIFCELLFSISFRITFRIKSRFFLSQHGYLSLKLFTIVIEMLISVLLLLIVFQSCPHDMAQFISSLSKSNFSTLLTSSLVTSLVQQNIKVTRSEVFTPSYISKT